MTLTDTPVLVVEADFGNGREPITGYVQRFNWRRGRTREREKVPPARGHFVLKNAQGAFDRDNSASPFYPGVRPNRPIWASAKVDSGIGPFRMGASPLGARDAFGGGTQIKELFTGRTEGGPHKYADASLAGAFVEWDAVDDSKRLNRDRSSSGYGSGNQLTGTRVNAVLDGTTPVWPAAERDVDPGARTVQAAAGQQGRYDYLLQVAESEGGVFFIGADGKAVFRDSDYAPVEDPIPFGDSGTEHRYRSIAIDDDDKEIFNAVTVTASGQADQTSEDLASQAEDGRADLPVATLLSNTVDMQELADSLAAAYSQSRRRISRMSFGVGSKTNWHKVISKEILERITGRHRPPYGVLIDQLLAIQGITGVVIDQTDWELAWDLALPVPAVPNTNLLTDNQTSIETDATGWTVEQDATIARVTTDSYVGSACLQITCDIGDVALVKTTPVTTAPVTVGETYRAAAFMKAGNAGDFFGSVHISWRDSGGAELSTVAPTQIIIRGSDDWKPVTVAEGVAPANATHAVVRLRVVEPYVIGATHLADAISLRHVEE